MKIGIGDWEFEIGIGDWDGGLDWDWGLVLGIRIGNWGLGLGIRIGD